MPRQHDTRNRNVISKDESRALLHNFKIKKALKNFSIESEDVTKKKLSTIATWESKLSKYEDLEEEEEWADVFGEGDWEQSPFIQSWDRKFIDEALLDDSDVSDEQDLEIVDEEDDLNHSMFDANGRDLAKYTSRFSKKVKSNLAEVKPNNVKIHISGSMQGLMKNGKFSDFKSKTRIRVYDMELAFNEEYLDMMMVLTGTDLKKCAYEIRMLTDNEGTKTTISNLDQPTKALKKLNNSNLVNMSVTSELNRSRHVQRVLDMLTPIKVKLERSKSTTSNTTVQSERGQSSNFMRVLSMVTPIKVKQERLNRTKALETSLVKEERQEVTLKRNYVSDSFYSASPSKRHRFGNDSVLSSTHLGEAPSFNNSLRTRSNQFRSVINSITPIKVKQRRIEESNQRAGIPSPHCSDAANSSHPYCPRTMADVSRSPNHQSYQSHRQQPCQGPCRCGHCEHFHIPHRQSYYPASDYRSRGNEQGRFEDRYRQYPADNSSTYNRNIGYSRMEEVGDKHASFHGESRNRSHQYPEPVAQRSHYQDLDMSHNPFQNNCEEGYRGFQYVYNRSLHNEDRPSNHDRYHKDSPSDHDRYHEDGPSNRDHQYDQMRHQPKYERSFDASCQNPPREWSHREPPEEERRYFRHEPSSAHSARVEGKDQAEHSFSSHPNEKRRVLDRDDHLQRTRLPLSPAKVKHQPSKQKDKYSKRVHPKISEIVQPPLPSKSKEPKNVVAKRTKLQPPRERSAEYIPVVSDLLNGLNRENRRIRIQMKYDVQLASDPSDEDKENSKDSSNFSNSFGDQSQGF